MNSLSDSPRNVHRQSFSHSKTRFTLIIAVLFFVFASVSGFGQPCQISARAIPSTICVGDSSQLSVNGGDTAWTYSWSPATYLSNPSIINPVATPPASIRYTVTVTSGPCAGDTSSVLVKVNPLPSSAFTFSPNFMCGNTPVSFQGPAGPNYSYFWNFGDPGSGSWNTSILQNPTHTFTSHGNGNQTFNVQLTVTVNGCSSTTMHTITVLQVPDASIQDLNFDPWKHCVSGSNITDTLLIDNTSTTILTNTHYHIDWGDGSAPYDSTVLPTGTSHAYTSIGNFAVVLTVMNAQCTSTQTYYFFNGSNPVGGLDNPGNTVGLCGVPKSISFGFTPSTANNSPGTTYTIMYDDGSPNEVYSQPPPTLVTHVYTDGSCGHTAQSGSQNSYSIKCTMSNPCGTSNSMIDPIQINEDPVSDFSINPMPGCINTNVVLTSTTVAPGFISPGSNQCSYTLNYHWVITPSSYTIVSGGLTQQALTVQFHEVKTYSITLTTNSGCTSVPITKTICISQPPEASFTVDKESGCAPLRVQTNNTSTSTDPCSTISYTWSVSNYTGSAKCPPNSSSFVISNTTTKNPFVIFNNPGIYRLKLEVNGACGIVTTYHDITVKSIPTIEIDETTTTPICAGESVSPLATFYSCYGTDSLTYFWSFPGGTPGSTTANPPGTIGYPNPGSYIITASAANECGTGSSDTPLIVNPLPVASATPATQSVCSGKPTSIVNFSSSITPGTTYSWTVTASTGITGFVAAGSGNSIPSMTPANAGISPGTITYTITPSVGNCEGNPFTHIITVNPIPVVTVSPLSPQTVCSGSSTQTIHLSSSVTGSTFSWAAATTDPITGFPVSGNTLDIPSFTPINTANTAGVITFTITATAAGCESVQTTYLVNVNPSPVMAVTPKSKVICSNTNTNIVLTANVANTTFIWNSTVVSGSISGNTNGSGTPISNTLQNTGSTYGIVRYVITPEANSCPGDTIHYLVYVQPVATVTATPPTQTICSGTSSQAINLSSPSTGIGNVTFSWTTVANPASGLSGYTPAGNGLAIAASTITSTLTTPGTVTYTITPSIAGCIGTANTATITINPAPMVNNASLTQTVCSGSPTSPVTLTSNLDPNVTFSWTASATPGITGYSSSGTNTIPVQTINNGTTTNGTVTYHIIPTSAFPGITCQGTPADYTIVVKPIPEITATPSTQEICSGNPTNILLTSNITNSTFSWTYSVLSGSVTGGSSGSGSTIAQVLTNAGTTNAVVRYVVTSSANGCLSQTLNVEITVKPKPTVTASPVSPMTVCSGSATQSINLFSSVTNSTFSWTASTTDPITGFPAGGNTSDIASFTPVNTSNTAGVITFVITATASGCESVPATYLVNVNPRPVMNVTPKSKVICSNTNTNIVLTSNVSNTTYTWNSAVLSGSISGNNNGSGTPISNTLQNTGSTYGTVRYVITPEANSCSGDTIHYLVYVQPIPTLTATPAAQTICSGSSSQAINLSSSVTGIGNVSFSWTTITNPVSGLTGYTPAGNGTTIAGSVINSTLTISGTVTYTITPSLAGCSGTTNIAAITINPAPAISNSPLTQTVCSGSPSTPVTLTSNLDPNVTFSWTASPTPGITGYSPSGTSTIPVQTINNNTITNGTVTYHIVPTSTFPGITCPGNPADYTIVVKPVPEITATPSSQEICSGNSTDILLTSNITGTTFSWIYSVISGNVNGGSSGSGSTIAQALTNTGTTDALVRYSVTSSANGCLGQTLSVEITVKPKPTVTASPVSPMTVCSGSATQNINLSSSVTNSTFSWDATTTDPITGFPGSGNTSNIASFTPVNTGNTAGVITFTITATAAGCESTPTNYLVNVNPRPAMTVTPKSKVICSNTNTNIVLTANVANTTYTWNSTVVSGNISGNTSASGTPISNTLQNTGTSYGTVRYVITPEANSCSGDTIHYLVYVQPVATATTTPPTQTICSGTSSQAIDLSSSSTGIGNVTYSWTTVANPASGLSGYTPSGNGTSIAASTITSTLTIPGTVTYTITPSIAGCSGSNSIAVITVKPLPTPGITGPSSACAGYSGNIYYTEPGMTNYQWSVSSGGEITAGEGTNTITVTWNTPGSQSICVNYVNTDGCTAVVPVCSPVTVNVIPIPALNGPLQVCENSTGHVYTTDAGMSNYQWQVSPGGMITSGAGTNAITVSWGGPGAQSVSVSYNQNGCPVADPTVINVNVNARPIPNITGPAVLCAGASGAIYHTEPGMTSYTWVISGGGTITSGANTETVTVTWNTPGPQTISVNYTNPAGCQATSATSYNVTVHPLPSPSISGPAGVCQGTGNNVYTTQSGMNNYLWNISPGGTITAGGTNSSNSVVITWDNPGNQTVSVIYTNLNGCTANPAFNYPVTVNPLPVLYTVQGGGEYCSGGTGLPVDLTGSETGITYQLYHDGIADGSPVVGTGSMISFGNKTAAGTYTVTAEVDATNCVRDMTGSALIVINPLPVAEAGPDQTIPNGTSTSLSGSSSGGTGIHAYQWTPISSIASGQGTLTPLTTNLYTNTLFTLLVTDSKGCSKSDQVNVVLSGDPLSVSASVNPNVICYGQSTQLTATGDGGSGAYTYSWICTPPGTPLWSSTEQNPIVSPQVTTTYTVTVNDGYNTATATANVLVNPLPTLFVVSGGGSYCSGGPGVPVGLPGSQAGVSYQLYRNGSLTGSPVNGTGGPISFGDQTVAGTYKVKGTIITTGCQAMMSDSTMVSILPLPLTFNVTGGGSYPSGGIGVPVGLSGSESGVMYRLIHETDTITPAPGIPGTGNPISFGNQTLAGNYTVIAHNATTGCASMMNGSVAIIINPYPAIFNVFGGGDLCVGDPGKEIGLDGSEPSIDYVLRRNNDSIAILAGTGDSLSFGTFITPGIYTIIGKNSSTVLTKMMNGNAIINVHPLPLVYLVVPSGDTCPGTEVFLNGSQAGIVYNLIHNNSDTVATQTGTGLFGLLSFGFQYDTGVYHAVATDPVTGCSNLMSGTVTIHPAPEIFDMSPLGIICPGTEITLSGSQTGIFYQLRRDSLTNVGSPIPGTGFPISFGPQTEPGVYRVIATNPLTRCYAWMNYDATIQPAPIMYTIIPNGDTCAGALIRLNGSQQGLVYELLLDGTIHLKTMSGTGNPLVFGTYFTAGSYSIVAISPSTLCETMMDSSLTILQSPITYDIYPNGIACAGYTIGLENSEPGVSYSLIRDGSIVAAGPIPGTGFAISFGPQYYAGTYTIEAVDTALGCSSTMSGTATLYPRPQQFMVQPEGTHCAGTDIYLNGSEIGIIYELLRDGVIQSSVNGTGGIIHFGPQYLEGVYTVTSSNPASSCDTLMLGSTTITPLPLSFNILPSGANCSPAEVQLDGSQFGFSYQLLKNGATYGIPVTGTGSAITFGMQMEGLYQIVATDPGTSCHDTMAGSAVITGGPVANAGNDTTVCALYPIPLNGHALNYSTVEWTTSGDGVIADPHQLNTLYFPGESDILTGSVNLFLLIYGTPQCLSATDVDTLLININQAPVALAGPDDTTCITNNYQLHGQAQHYSAIEWVTSGDGSFDNPTTLNPFYLPGPQDNAVGEVMLIMHATGTLTCSQDFDADSMILVIQPLPIAFAGPDDTICENDTYRMNGLSSYSSSVQWTTTGDGYFDNISIPDALYTPGPNDKAIGHVNIVLTASGIQACDQETRKDTMMLYIHPLPVVNAGSDATICSNGTYNTAGSAQNQSSLLWTSTGDGSFSNPSILNTVYSPGPGDILYGSVYLILTGTGANHCSGELQKDSLLLSFYPMPVANAGVDTTVCSNTAIQLNGAASDYMSVLWSSKGDGQFDDPSIMNPHYLAGINDIINGSVILTMTVNGQMECSSQTDTDTILLTFRNLPTASLAGTQVICKGDTATLSLSLTGTPPWDITYTNGTSTQSILNIPSSPYLFSIAPLSTTTYTLLTVQDAYCTGAIENSSATVTVNPVPEEFPMMVTNGGGFCEGSTGVEILLTGSQSGIFYQLLFGGQPTGFPVMGTGGPISFGYQTVPGFYQMKATHPQTLCETLFSDSMMVVMFPTPDINFSSDSACIGEPTHFFIEGMDVSKVAMWEWNFGDGTSESYSAPVEPEHIYPATGQYEAMLFVSDTNGCTRAISHPVYIGTPPIAQFSHNAPVCQDLSVAFADHSYTTTTSYLKSWHWDFGDGTDTLIVWPGNPDVSHHYLHAGDFPVVLTVTTNEGCSAFKNRTVHIDAAPVSNFSYSNPCNEEEVAFHDISQTNGGGEVVEWYWNFGDPGSGINNTASNQDPVHIFSQPGNYQVTLAVMNTHGCNDTIIKTVAVQMEPVAMFSADETCLHQATRFNDLSLPNSTAIIEWDWDFGDGSAHSDLQNPVHLYSTAGQYQVTLTVKNDHLCSHDTTITVSVITLPIASFQSNAPQCSGSPVYYMNLSTSSHGQIIKWEWDFGDGADTTILYPGIPNVSHIFAGAGLQHIVRLTVTTTDSCTSFIEQIITSVPQPAANFSFPAATCENTSIAFTDLTQNNGGGPITAWSWNFGDPTSGTQNVSSLQNPVHIFTGPGNFDVRLIVTSLNFCTDTIIKTVSVNAQPQADFSADTACLGSITTFTDQSLPNAPSMTGWDWDFGDGTPHSYIQNPAHLYAQPGVHNVTLTITNANGCTATIAHQVKVIPKPVASFIYSSGNCTGSPVSFFDQSYTSEGYIAKWIWDFGDGNTITITTPGTQNVTHTYVNAGNYNATLTIQTADSCSASVSHLVTVTATPMANFSSTDTNCQQSPVQFYDLSQQNGGGPIVTWEWDFGDPGSGVNNHSAQQHPEHVYQTSGTFQVTLIVTNVNNCRDTMTKSIEISGLPTVDFEVDTVCLGDTTHFTDQTIANFGSLISWLWNFGDGNTSTVQNPSHYYAASGTYQVSLTVTNSFSCSSSTMKPVIIKVPPISSFTYENTCVGAGTQFTDASTPGFGSITQWHWEFGDGDTSSLQNPAHTYADNGTFVVSLTVTNSQGCTDEYSLPITIFDQPEALFSSYSTFCPKGMVTFADHSIPSGSPIVGWYWIFEDGFYSTSSNPTYTFPVIDTTYQVTLIVTDENGCKDTIVNPVSVKPGFNFTFTADSACFGSITHFSAVNLAAGDTIHDLSWNFGDPASGTNNTSTLYNPTHAFTEPTTYIVKLKAYNSNNCIDSIYREVVVNPGPIADFGFDSIPHCDSLVVFTNLSNGNNAGIDTLIWQFGDGQTGIQTQPLPTTITHQYNSFGSFDVSLTTINGNGCRSSITKPIVVTCIASAFTGLDTIHCQKKPIIFVDSSGPVSLINNWQWEFGDGSDSVYSAYQPAVSHEYEYDGTYNVNLIVSFISNGVSISDTSWQTVVIRKASVASFRVEDVCWGDTSRFINLTNNNNTEIDYTNWQFGDGTSISDTSSSGAPAHLYPHPGYYTVSYVVANNNGCTDTATRTTRVFNLPMAGFSTSKACSRDITLFTDNSIPGDTTVYHWVWDFNDPWHPYDTIQQQNPGYEFYSPGTYPVTLTVVDLNGCRDTVSENVDVNLSPTSSFSITEDLDNQPGKVMFTNESENYTGFEWNLGNGTITDALSPIVTYKDDGPYTVRLITWNENCTDTTDYVYDFIFHGLYVPNAFSPTNILVGVMKFKPVGINLEKYHAMVFDLFGNLLWESWELDKDGQPVEGWDGYYKGVLQAQGTYVWKIEATFKDGKVWEGSTINSNEGSTMGTVTLVR